MHGMPLMQPRKASANFKPDVELELFCQNAEMKRLVVNNPSYNLGDAPFPISSASFAIRYLD